MRSKAALAAATAAFALSGCQTTQTEANYVKLAAGPKADVAVAQCKEFSAKARHIVVGIGGPEMLVVGLIGTAVATAAKQAQVFEQCMTAQGYGKVGAKPAGSTAVTPAAAVPAKATASPAALKPATRKSGPANAPAETTGTAQTPPAAI